ncbi:MAG: hypothetical protein FWD94_05705 [Treponema sp.]|nr:hypothetical protein [Treponema sp.]
MNRARILAFILVFLGLALPAFAQESGGPASVAELRPDLLLQYTGRSNFWNPNVLMRLDGTGLSYRESLELLRTVPANGDLMRQIKRNRVTSHVFAGFTLAGVATAAVFALTDLPGRDIGLYSAVFTVMGFGVTTTFVMQAENRRFLRAVDNHNLYVLEIPVSGLRN